MELTIGFGNDTFLSNELITESQNWLKGDFLYQNVDQSSLICRFIIGRFPYVEPFVYDDLPNEGTCPSE